MPTVYETFHSVCWEAQNILCFYVYFKNFPLLVLGNSFLSLGQFPHLNALVSSYWSTDLLYGAICLCSSFLSGTVPYHLTLWLTQAPSCVWPAQGACQADSVPFAYAVVWNALEAMSWENWRSVFFCFLTLSNYYSVLHDALYLQNGLYPLSSYVICSRKDGKFDHCFSILAESGSFAIGILLQLKYHRSALQYPKFILSQF
jgi:hypothetical protein